MTTPVRRGSLASMAVPKAITAPEPETAQAPAESPKGAPSPKSPTPRRAPGDVKTVQARINKQGWKALRDLAATGRERANPAWADDDRADDNGADDERPHHEPADDPQPGAPT